MFVLHKFAILADLECWCVCIDITNKTAGISEMDLGLSEGNLLVVVLPEHYLTWPTGVLCTWWRGKGALYMKGQHFTVGLSIVPSCFQIYCLH